MSYFNIDDQLLAKKILAKAYKAGIEPTFVKAFSSSGIKGEGGMDLGTGGAVIHRRSVSPGDGLIYAIPIVRDINYRNRVFDNDEVRGKESVMKFESDIGKIRCIDTPLKLSFTESLRLATPTRIEQEMVPILTRAIRRSLEYDVWQAATWSGIYPTPTAVGTKPVYDRIVLSMDMAAYVSRADYNNAGGNYRQIAGANGITRQIADPAVNIFNTAVLDRMKLYAILGGERKGKEELMIPPETYLSKGIRADEWIVFIHPACEPQLKSDPKWLAQAQRNQDIKDAPEVLTGSRFLGKWGGLRVYVNDWLAEFEIEDNGHRYAWNMLCAASAIDLGIWKDPELHIEYADHKKQLSMSFREFRGQKAITIPSKTTAGARVEFGIIHNMSCIA